MVSKPQDGMDACVATVAVSGGGWDSSPAMVLCMYVCAAREAKGVVE